MDIHSDRSRAHDGRGCILRFQFRATVRLTLVVLLISLISSIHPQGATLLVGVGRNFQTIGQALFSAQPGDFIDVSAGTYTESLTITKPVTLSAGLGVYPTIKGALVIASSNVTVEGFDVFPTGTGGHGVVASGVTNLTIRQCKVHGASLAGFYCRNSSAVSLDSCEIFDCGTDGVTIISGHSTDNSYIKGIVIQKCVLRNNGEDGAKIHGQFLTVQDSAIFDNITTNWMTTHPDGIQLNAGTADGYTSVQHCRIFRNTIRNQTQNIFTEGSIGGLLSDCDDVAVIGNIVYNSAGIVNGVNLDLIATKHIMIKQTKNCLIANNTIGRTSLGIYIQNCPDTGTINVKNNLIMTAIGHGLWSDSKGVFPGLGLNANFYGTNNSMVRMGATYYDSVQTLFNATGFEAVGGVGDPKVDSFPMPKPQVGSPLSGRGLRLENSVAFDFLNSQRSLSGAWDIGALIGAVSSLPKSPTNLRVAQP